MSGVSVEQAGPHDLAAIEALLAANQLPTAGLRESLGTALVARVGSRTIGSVALEVSRACCCDRWRLTLPGAAAGSVIS